jgi:protein TonB
VAKPDPRLNERPGRLGYFVAISASAFGHAAIVLLIFVLLPRLFRSETPPPVAYTVKIVDAIPAGDLGTRLPPLASHRARHEQAEKPKPAEHEHSSIIPPRVRDNDKNVLALNTIATPTPTPEPTPESEPTATESATPTPAPVRRHRKPAPTVTPTPHPRRVRHGKPAAKPSPMVAKAVPTPNLKEELEKLHNTLVAENRDNEHRIADMTPSARPTPSAEEGRGQVVASIANEGSGLGVGSGKGSMGILQDPDFLSYYQTVQDRIKKAWSFAAGNNDLTTQALFAINADGQLTGVKITESSHDSAYDDSVMRAIRRAAPFPPPPEKYRSQFAQGIQATFRLGELQS